MSEIARSQQEAYKKLSQAKHLLSQIEDKSSRAYKYAYREKEEIAKALDDIRIVLVNSQ